MEKEIAMLAFTLIVAFVVIFWLVCRIAMMKYDIDILRIDINYLKDVVKINQEYSTNCVGILNDSIDSLTNEVINIIK